MVDNKERKSKEKLIEAKKALRKKSNMLKSGKLEDEMTLETLYKPITKPLKELVSLQIAAAKVKHQQQ